MAPIEIHPVRLGIANAYLVRQDGTILVDTGEPGSEEAILDAAESLGIAPGDIRLILLTHGHGDHAGSACALRKMTGAKVAIHRDDAGKLRNGHQGPLRATCITGRVLGLLFNTEKKARYPPLEPDILITDTLDLRDYGIDGTVIPTPGHTPGSVSVILDNGEAIVGDLIFPSVPSEKPCMPFWADTPHEVKKSIGTIRARRLQKVYTGHGGPFTGEEIEKMR
ncbi:MBL fold metallo-hydrolase [Methanogenium organophilum]|uniref:MBL fold metallo-hydrolase n=1 Tax=Methanogenium organophilum TaxID=2199 RepID=A0A9X9T9J9_METOG|nr:MBL fold metallo-hydrolase [Methanogenium organophilum]WAI02172.1 MBL fold metallo-hydrolase [Methanogenium organophilum]